MWIFPWKDKVNKPHAGIDSLPHCTNLLPKIRVLLRLFDTLPITSVTPERKFSKLRRLEL